MITRRNFLKASIGLSFLAPLAHLSKLSARESHGTKSPSKVLLRLAKCIAEVETGQDDDLQGKVGERSKYQISRIVWEQHFPGRAFVECYGINADECAIKHLEWLNRHLNKREAFWFAYAWKAGLSEANETISSLSFHNITTDYAKRVSNLYNDRNFK